MFVFYQEIILCLAPVCLDCMPPLLTPFTLTPPPSPSGATAVCPVQASEEVTLGLTAELSIYAEAEPPLASHEIEWKRSDGTPVSTDSRVSLHDSNYRLVIRNVNLQDSGVYRIEIVRETGPVVYQVLASTAIDLNVYGKCKIVL